MNFGNLFGSTPGKTVTIPTFKQGKEHDSVDLQIKSLLYIFKRLKINKLSPFIGNNSELKYTNGSSTDLEDESSKYNLKLDLMYNVRGFKEVLINDEYRVLVDYIKNKFRSYCILSDYPSSSLSRPNSPVKGGTANELGDFPAFYDFKERRVTNYKFIRLSIENTTINTIANILASSFLYEEHSIVTSVRFEKAMAAISEVLHPNRMEKPAEILSITEDEKALIINRYLRKLAFETQLNRIYDEYIKKYPVVKTNPETSKQKILKSSKSISDMNASFSSDSTRKLSLSRPTSPVKPRVLSPRKSIADLRSYSHTPSLKATPPPKLDFKSPVIINSQPMSPTSISTTSSNSDFGPDSDYKKGIRDKCSNAIKAKIESEKEKIIQV